LLLLLWVDLGVGLEVRRGQVDGDCGLVVLHWLLGLAWLVLLLDGLESRKRIKFC